MQTFRLASTFITVDTNAARTPQRFIYPTDEATYGDTYGALYNWHIVETGNFCPYGWHVPNNEEWNALEEY